MKTIKFKSSLLMLVFTLVFTSFSFTLPVSALENAPNLGTASTFGLMGVSISNTNPTFVNGNVGSDGQTSAPTITNGSNFLSDATYHAADAALGLAIDEANLKPCTINGVAGADLGNKIFLPGVYCYPGAVNVTGTMTLSGNGVYIFRIAGAFNTSANAIIGLNDNALAGNIFFVVAGASTLGANTTFNGTIMSKAPITVSTSLINGRLLSQPAVTISTTTILVPAPIPVIPVTPAPIVVIPVVVTPTPTAIPTPTVTPIVLPSATPASTVSPLPMATLMPAPAVTPAVIPTLTVTSTPTVSPEPTPVSKVATLTSAVLSETCPPAVPASALLISDSPSLRVWLLMDGKLLIHTKLANDAKGTGTWTFNLGGKVYTVLGNECVAYVISDAPVGTYKIVVQFTQIDGPSIYFESPPLTVPTVNGGKLPNTASPLYNLLLVGFIIILIGAVSLRRRILQ